MSKILLLGSGYPKARLKTRDGIGRALEQLGHKVTIMEYTEQLNKPLHQTFYELVKKKHNAIIALYFNKSAHDAVNFELGFLTHRYIDENLWNKFLILTQDILEEKELTSYLRKGLFSQIIREQFTKNSDIVEKIDRFTSTR